MNEPFQNEVRVLSGTQTIVVDASGQVTVVNSGPPGPRGAPGAYGGEVALQSHVDSSSPHPAYDDIPSLTLLFENGLI